MPTDKIEAAFIEWRVNASSFELFDIFKAGYTAAEQVRASQDKFEQPIGPDPVNNPTDVPQSAGSFIGAGQVR